MRLLLLAIDKNTSLTKASSLLSQVAAKQGLVPDDQTRKLLEAAKQSAGFDSGAGGDPVRWLENDFANLNALVRGDPGQPVPLDAVLTRAKELRDYFMQSNASGAPAQKGGGGWR